jgi:hypothetical protein
VDRARVRRGALPTAEDRDESHREGESEGEGQANAIGEHEEDERREVEKDDEDAGAGTLALIGGASGCLSAFGAGLIGERCAGLALRAPWSP